MNRARITVVEKVYFEADDQEPRSVDSMWAVPVKTQEQPFSRILKVGNQWTWLPFGWFEGGGCSLLTISNQGTRRERGRGQPTKEEREQMAKAVLEIRLSPDDPVKLVVRPGTSTMLQPVGTNETFVRCAEGECWITLTVFPE